MTAQHIQPPANQMLKRLLYEAERTLKDGDYKSLADLLDAMPTAVRDVFLGSLSAAELEALEPFVD